MSRIAIPLKFTMCWYLLCLMGIKSCLGFKNLMTSRENFLTLCGLYSYIQTLRQIGFENTILQPENVTELKMTIYSYIALRALAKHVNRTYLRRSFQTHKMKLTKYSQDSVSILQREQRRQIFSHNYNICIIG